MEDLNIIINGKKINARKGDSILECAKKQGIDIPTLCNDPRLDPYSSCFVCVVEIEGMKGLQPACSTPVREGMSIETHNEKVKIARKAALDLIVSNHYADCVAPCKTTCPAGVDVQGYISLIEKGMYSEAVALIKEVNPLPAICGRVCVRPCEVACRRNLLEEGTGVGIDYLKRFASDFDLNSKTKYVPTVSKSTGKKVAVIGAGPGGLSVAWFLQQKGHQVDIYEASKHAGGMLRYGIPPYRLPNEIIDAEVESIKELGTRVFFDKKLGENLPYKEIANNYHATVLTIGSQKGTGVGCPGDDAGNVFSGIDFLRNIEVTGQKPDFSGKTVAVIGGGNTAMDCCRTAMRLGAKKVYVVYRRTEKEMPANPIEIHESKEEGIEYLFLNNPVEIIKDRDGNIKTMRLIKMELGEPDSSGRRRPVPVEGSEYDLKLDYVLAAIGQKTQVNFLDEINNHSSDGELKINRWGDIDADRKTLQTGIRTIFAAGDGVTGPATLIEAIAQAKTAARSCHQFLSGDKIQPEKTEFISRKDNFKIQSSEDYKLKFAPLKRQEMPLIPPSMRQNFNEVELGYEEKAALDETARCLECGCSEYYSCDLKILCDEYGADQQKFAGDYKKYDVRFDHPYIEIDNNKCILCSRCVRVCQEVVGANALGLVNRGFETHIAPAMGASLSESDCESCGLCISACPTGAITENKTFKPGPVKLEKFETICHYCSVGCTINIEQHKNYTWKVSGSPGLINKEGDLCRYGKFAYQYRNRTDRILRPMKKTNGGFVPISYEEAFEIIAQKAKNTSRARNMVFAGARLSNEELVLIRKLAIDGMNTDELGSFHYLGRNKGYQNIVDKNVPFADLEKAGHIFLFGSEIHQDNTVAGFMVNKAHKHQGVKLSYVSLNEHSKLQNKADESLIVDSYYPFIKAVNHYLLSNNKQNAIFIKDHIDGFDAYKEELLSEDYQELIYLSGTSREAIEGFAEEFNSEPNAVLITAEKDLSASEVIELKNLCILTGKLGKTASGLICLKQKNNSQGLFDMDIVNDNNMLDLLESDDRKNFFIFGEDPIGCSVYEDEVNNWFNKADFVMVQDFFMSETAKFADLILPAAIPGEFQGSFTNTQKMIQVFEENLEASVDKPGPEQLVDLLGTFGFNGINSFDDVHNLALNYIAQKDNPSRMTLNSTSKDHFAYYFNYGCDLLTKLFDESFEKAFIQNK